MPSVLDVALGWIGLGEDIVPINQEQTHAWMSRNWHYSILLATIYLIVVFGGQRLMRQRQRFELKRPLIVWNIVLAMFSIAGMRTLWPEFKYALVNYGFHGSMFVVGNLYQGSNGIWLYLFALSKVYEFGDTMFLVLRKRPIRFLHWYHHIATCIYCWYVYQFNTGAQIRWGTFMNYTVHSFMYSYYAFRAADIKLPKITPMLITSMQVTQMIIGTYVCLGAWLCVQFGFFGGYSHCQTPPISASLQLAMYASYLILFSQLFYQSYIVKSSSSHHHINKKQ